MGTFTAGRPASAREQRSLTFIAPPIGAYTQALQDYSSGDTEGAMRQNTVFKCIRLVSDVMAQMTPIAYRGPGPGHGPADRLPSPQILDEPSADADIYDFTYMLITSELLRGNVYGDITARDKFGYPVQIELKHPDRCKVVEDRDGVIVYKYGHQTMARDRVWHKMAYRMPGVATGLSPIKYMQKLI